MPDLFGSTQGGDATGLRQMYGLQNRYDYSHLSPELAQAERTQDQRQLVANAIMQGALKPRRGKMVGRLYQKANIGEGLGQIGEALIGGWMSGDIEDKRAEAGKAEQQRVADAINAYMEKTEGQYVPERVLPGASPEVREDSNLESIIQGSQPQDTGLTLRSLPQGPPPLRPNYGEVDTPMRTVEPGPLENAARQAGPVGNYLADNFAVSGNYAVGDDALQSPMQQIPEAFSRFGANVPPQPPLYAQRYEAGATPSPELVAGQQQRMYTPYDPGAVVTPAVPATEGPVNRASFIPATAASKLRAIATAAADPNPQVRAMAKFMQDAQEKDAKVAWEKQTHADLLAKQRDDYGLEKEKLAAMTEQNRLTREGNEQRFKSEMDLKERILLENIKNNAARAEDARLTHKQLNDIREEGIELRRQGLDLERMKLNAEKMPTGSQEQANLYARRAASSDKIISDLESEYSPLAINFKESVGKTWIFGGLLEAGVNQTLSLNSQRADQAQRDFINAVLRRESGAVISDAEFANARKQYFPQSGDKSELLMQKRANRQIEIDGIRQSSGPFQHQPRGGGSPVVRNQAEYDQLPPGTVYTDPNGNQRTKQ